MIYFLLGTIVGVIASVAAEWVRKQRPYYAA